MLKNICETMKLLISDN